MQKYLIRTVSVRSKLIPMYSVNFTLHIGISFDLTKTAQIIYFYIGMPGNLQHPVIVKLLFNISYVFMKL